MADFPAIRENRPTHRLINSRWPSVGLFDELADDEAELRILFDLEMMTNPRNQIASGRLALIPDSGLLVGPTANMAMAAFVHCHDDGARFNSAKLGAWYAALDIETAIEETVYHLTKRLQLSEGGFPQQMQMRELITTVCEALLDLCGEQDNRPDLYAPADYTDSQAYSDSVRWPLRQDGAAGIRYDSVRRAGGINVCVFKPQALTLPITQGGHYQYDWNIKGKVSIAKLTEIKRPT